MRAPAPGAAPPARRSAGGARLLAALLIGLVVLGPAASATAAPAPETAARGSAHDDGLARALRPGFAPDAAPGAPGAPAPRVARVAPVAPVALPLPGPFPAVELRTLLLAVHLVGLCFGLGGSTLLYFWILRWMRWGALPDEILRTFDFVAKTVAVGLGLLWLSGLGFLATYEVWDPAKLANPKLWAKLVIVTALSLNGLLVHRHVSPFVRGGARAPLLARETRARRLLFTASGALSGTSWYAAFALGLLHEFNGGVPATAILGAWALALAAVFLALSLALRLGQPRPRSSRRPDPGADRARGPALT